MHFRCVKLLGWVHCGLTVRLYCGQTTVKSLEDILILSTTHIGVGRAAFSINTRCSIPLGLGRGDLCIGIFVHGSNCTFP